jgi:hypothetical protein
MKLMHTGAAARLRIQHLSGLNLYNITSRILNCFQKKFVQCNYITENAAEATCFWVASVRGGRGQ